MTELPPTTRDLAHYNQIEKSLALATSTGLHPALAAARVALGRGDYKHAAECAGWAVDAAEAARKHALEAARQCKEAN